MYLLFQATSITRRFMPSPLPPSQPLTPCYSGPVWRAWPSRGWVRHPLLILPCALPQSDEKAKATCKSSRNVKPNYPVACSETESLRWPWGSMSTVMETQSSSFGGQLGPRKTSTEAWEPHGGLLSGHLDEGSWVVRPTSTAVRITCDRLATSS